jgi:hypothetical protein
MRELIEQPSQVFSQTGGLPSGGLSQYITHVRMNHQQPRSQPERKMRIDQGLVVEHSRAYAQARH